MFDPFDDFEERGYLRNHTGEKNPVIIKHLEHTSFLMGIDDAFRQLSQIGHLNYSDVLSTHKILFNAMYPWAGQDRLQNAPDIAVSKGDIIFAHPNDAKGAVEHALQLGQDRSLMQKKPGVIMGYLAYGHPFLDGNGRTIMVVHAELAERAGISFEWSATDKEQYLTALTAELHNPNEGILDGYLKPFIRASVGRNQLAGHVVKTGGLGGDTGRLEDTDRILGKFSDPALQAQYKKQVQQREAYKTLKKPSYD